MVEVAIGWNTGKEQLGKMPICAIKLIVTNLQQMGHMFNWTLLMTTDGISYHFAIDVTANLVSILWLKDRWYL